ncbi:flagellar filament capping protein FliD [Evansella tamaricis]|uniref:Flagellar hook-associated protein 2 n=1 Tax=Evansella tamaricis TaxID=2069301 RepID=A0ABS6JGK0_9BACI|nr:flagellar filament capping protein FliD [Evansella tamaricis]MBU9712804.1 flagellar filament capping protein FliD [Evansella tamaricis]
MRIGGLASGMDTDQIIKDLMRAERMRGDKFFQNRTTLEWQRDSYREINLKITSLRDSVAARGIALQSTLMQKKVTSSNERAVTATAGANAPNTSIQMKVDRLATSTTFVSNQPENADVLTKKIGEWGDDLFHFDGDGKATLTFQVKKPGAGQEFENVSVEVHRDDTLQGVLTKVNRAGAGFNAFIDNSADGTSKVVMSMSSTGAGGGIKFLDPEQPMESDPVEGEPDPPDEVTGAGAFESMDTEDGDDGGEAGPGVEEPPGTEGPADGTDEPGNGLTAESMARINARNFFEQIGFAVVNSPQVGDNGETIYESGEMTVGAGVRGDNARVQINGHWTERTTNSFSLNGITYNLAGVTNGETVMITTVTNTDKIMEDIMKFVEEYNELVDMINGALREERYRDYKPLTDDQKEAMSEKEIEMWEERARSGLLRNDSTLSSTLGQMRMAMFSGISDENPDRILKDLSAFGLVTSPDYMDGGKIILDPNSRTMPNGARLNGEDRMRYYIENHGEEVHQLFNGNSDDRSGQGVIRQLRGTLDTAINQITTRAGREGRTNHQFTIGRQLNTLEDQISNFERRMQQTEDRYWRQFSAMEKAMAELNSQADQIWSMLMPQG